MITDYIGKMVAIELFDKTKIIGHLNEAGYINNVYTINIRKDDEIIDIEPTEIKNIYRIQEVKENTLSNPPTNNKENIQNISDRINLAIDTEEMLKQTDKYGPSLDQFNSVVAQNIYYFLKNNVPAQNICLIIRESFCSADILFELIRLLDCNYKVFCDSMRPNLKYLKNLYFVNNLNIKKPEKNCVYDLLFVASDKQVDISDYKSKNFFFMYNPQELINYEYIEGKIYTFIYGPRPSNSKLKVYKDVHFVYIYGGLAKNTYKAFGISKPEGNYFQLL
ncbi:hypothetical protein CDIK_0603 [Cucumispora dikerogammari]|nr:hypothetical protein CDIK_0603 [Cucumispora dikerogammari]